MNTSNVINQDLQDHKVYNYDMSNFNTNIGDKVAGGVQTISSIDNAGTQIFRLVNLQQKQFFLKLELNFLQYGLS